jgi:NADPH:quinone reductase-like Zn-dependent oxidoreductase
MRAVGVTEFGGPEMLRVLELPDPVPGPGEVGIRVRTAAVNPTDTVLRSGGRASQLAEIPPPYVPGMDLAGVLEQVGEGVSTDLDVGDDVIAIVVPRGAHGAYAERVVVPAASAARAPAGASYEEAATLPMNGLTARLALDVLDLDPGQWLAITGAAGAVGGYALELAKAKGLQVVADASATDRELVEGLGADAVVERGPGFADRVRSVVPQGVDAVIDAALLNELVAPAVHDGGGIATLRGFTGRRDRDIAWHPVYVRDYALAQGKLDELRDLAEAGSLTLRVARTLTAQAAPEAHRLLEAGGVRGRLVLEF